MILWNDSITYVSLIHSYWTVVSDIGWNCCIDCCVSDDQLARHRKDLQQSLKPGPDLSIEGDDALTYFTNHTAQIEVRHVFMFHCLVSSFLIITWDKVFMFHISDCASWPHHGTDSVSCAQHLRVPNGRIESARVYNHRERWPGQQGQWFLPAVRRSLQWNEMAEKNKKWDGLLCREM